MFSQHRTLRSDAMHGQHVKHHVDYVDISICLDKSEPSEVVVPDSLQMFFCFRRQLNLFNFTT